MSWRPSMLVILALTAGGSLSGCASHPDPWKDAGDRKRVVVSFAPLASLVQKIGGDHVKVVCLTTATGPHHYDARAKETIAVRGADLMLINGLGLDESFSEKIRDSSANPKLRVKEGEENDYYVEIGEEIEHGEASKLLLPFRKLAGDSDNEHKHAHGHGHTHTEGQWDPHIWLGFASIVPAEGGMIDVICKKLCFIDEDEQHKKEYQSNAEALKKELLNLATKGQKALKDKKDRRMISFHDSLRYLARDLLQGKEKDEPIVGVIEVAPGEPPTAKQFEKLLNTCKDKNIKYIATEKQYPKALAKKIQDDLAAKDQKVKVIEIDPLETAEPAELNGDWYVNQLQKIIETLEKELE